MSEKKDIQAENVTENANADNLGKVKDILAEDRASGNLSALSAAANKIKSLKDKLEEKLALLESVAPKDEPKAEQATAIPAEKPNAPSAEIKPEIKEEKAEPIAQPLPEKKAEKPRETAAPAVEEKPAEKVKEKPAAKAEEAPAPIPQAKPEKAPEIKEEREEKKQEAPAPTAEKAEVAEQAASIPAEEKPRPSFIVRRHLEYIPTSRPQRDKTAKSERPPRGEKPAFGERPPRGDRPAFNKDGKVGERPAFNKKPFGEKPAVFADKGGVKKKSGFVAPMVIPEANNRHSQNAKKKQSSDRMYEDKHTQNKRSLIRNNVTIDDFDENKTGYRKFRPVKKAKEEANVIKIEKAVVSSEIIPIKTLSEKIGIGAAEITKRLFALGMFKTINESIDFDTAAYIADDIGVALELKVDKTAEDVLSEGFGAEVDAAEDLVRRPPVVTVMGHVDHGKTSILDRIRKTNVTAGEAGGITQHIGAYQVTAGGNVITFLDTPGHAAFTAMRARGAQATDIAILVVAADDGIMPQTVEAISHAKAANVPIIVAINKIDKPEANVERIKTQLTEHGLLPEEWGGDAILCPVSAKTGEGFEELLNNINLVAEVAELKANPNRKAKGVVIEAKLDVNKGPIATVLVQNGTLRVSDNVIVGTATGKIRAMTDDKGRKVTSAGPSVPVSIMGLEEVPQAGDILFAGEQEKLIKMVAEERKNKERESMLQNASKVTLDDVFNKMEEGQMKVLNIIVKADVQGSVEAVKQSLEKLSNEEVRVSVIHAAAGAIKESDIMLAESSNAIIIGFNVRPDSNAKTIAEKSGVDIRLYRIIYEAIEEVEKALKGMLKPVTREIYLGKVEVREVFKISGVGQVAGAYVTDGKIIRSGKLRIYRDDVMICEGNVLQLKRFKDDVKEVAQGYECGISIEKFNDIKVGDFIECYDIQESAQ